MSFDSSGSSYLTVRQFSEKHSFLSQSGLRWLLFKDDKFRSHCVRRLGRKILLDESAVMQFIEGQKDGGVK